MWFSGQIENNSALFHLLLSELFALPFDAILLSGFGIR